VEEQPTIARRTRSAGRKESSSDGDDSDEEESSSDKSSDFEEPESTPKRRKKSSSTLISKERRTSNSVVANPAPPESDAMDVDENPNSGQENKLGDKDNYPDKQLSDKLHDDTNTVADPVIAPAVPPETESAESKFDGEEPIKKEPPVEVARSSTEPLQVAAAEQEDSYDGPIEKTFSELSLLTKIQILTALVDWNVSENGKIVGTIDAEDADDVRYSPIGTDRHGHVYWYFQDYRLYREEPPEYPSGEESVLNFANPPKWMLVASNEEEWLATIESLRASRNAKEKELAGEIEENVLPEVKEKLEERTQRVRASCCRDLLSLSCGN
jgi:hypothetical protein